MLKLEVFDHLWLLWITDDSQWSGNIKMDTQLSSWFYALTSWQMWYTCDHFYRPSVKKKTPHYFVLTKATRKKVVCACTNLMLTSLFHFLPGDSCAFRRPSCDTEKKHRHKSTDQTLLRWVRVQVSTSTVKKHPKVI